jgi:branched-chain amino acid transport system permease protein
VALDYLFNGLTLGAVYALIAVGYTMVYGIVRLINFAHGEFFMAGAFAGYFVLRDAGLDRVAPPGALSYVLPYAGALLAGAAVAGVLAVLAERFCYRPIRRSSRIAALLTAVGLSILLQNLARQVPALGPTPRDYPTPKAWVDAAQVPVPSDRDYYEVRPFDTASGTVEVEEVVVARGGTMDPADRARLEGAGTRVFARLHLPLSTARGVVLLVLAATAAGLWWLVRRTRLGKAMRATSEDLEAATLMGIDVNRVISRTFFVGGLVAGVGGVCFCATTQLKVDPLTGFMPGLKAFIAAVAGGIGSIPGAVAGGMGLGLAETLFAAYVSTQWKDVLAFLVLIVVLLVRPTGLLGRARREKV